MRPQRERGRLLQQDGRGEREGRRRRVERPAVLVVAALCRVGGVRRLGAGAEGRGAEDHGLRAEREALADHRRNTRQGRSENCSRYRRPALSIVSDFEAAVVKDATPELNDTRGGSFPVPVRIAPRSCRCPARSSPSRRPPGTPDCRRRRGPRRWPAAQDRDRDRSRTAEPAAASPRAVARCSPCRAGSRRRSSPPFTTAMSGRPSPASPPPPRWIGVRPATKPSPSSKGGGHRAPATQHLEASGRQSPDRSSRRGSGPAVVA